MTPERWTQVRQLFEAVIEKPAARRRAFLEQICGSDPQLMAEVASLVASHDESTAFLEEPIAHLSAIIPQETSFTKLATKSAERRPTGPDPAGTKPAESKSFAPKTGEPKTGERKTDERLEPALRLELNAASHATARAPATRAHPDDLTGYRLGPYEFVRELGTGGMGAVWMASRTGQDFNKQVAIKMMRRALDAGPASSELLRRFHTERQVLASLDHPHIAVLIDGGSTAADPAYGIAAGLPYIVMEYVEGTPIDRYCDNHKLSITARLYLFRQVCEAVHFAHQHLIVHRDIKAANVLVTNEGIPKLLDFGIAKLLNPGGIDMNQTRHDLRPMTLDYASPEQIKGLPITTVTDVYSLGVLFYRLLTGKLPHGNSLQTRAELQHQICEMDAAPPSEVVLSNRKTAIPDATQAIEIVSETREAARRRLQGKLRGDLDAIALKALERDPQLRYASAQAFSEDIARYLNGLPVLARGDAPGYRLSKLLRRNWRIAAAAALFGGALSALAVANFVAARGESERNRVLRATLLQAEATSAESTVRLGDELLRRGAKEQALAQYNAAKELYRKLLAEEPSDGDTRRELQKLEATLASLNR